jgi:hypothetical protein
MEKDKRYKMEFKNDTTLEFTDISSEAFREYEFETKTIRIEAPLKLNVSSTGGHRIFDSAGNSHYIPAGWLRITWQAKAGFPHFVK